MAADPIPTMDQPPVDGAAPNADSSRSAEITFTRDPTYASSVSVPTDDLRRLVDELKAIDNRVGPSASRHAARRLLERAILQPPQQTLLIDGFARWEILRALLLTRSSTPSLDALRHHVRDPRLRDVGPRRRR
jgi:hypothetical protein